jgi:6-phosphogluconolactonase
MSYELISFSNAEDLARAAAERWIKSLAAREAALGQPCTVALSGGRITKTVFSEVVRQSSGSRAAGASNSYFRDVHFFWADERCVPPDDPESNYAMSRQLLFIPLGIEPDKIHRLQGEAPEAKALAAAISEITTVCPDSGGQPVLDLVFLGMGEDGHVASLFPGESEQAVRNTAVYRAVTAVKPPPRRITLGYGAIAAAKEVWVVVSGAGKEAALKESLTTAGKTPLARVLRSRAQTLVLTDVRM